jgi:hypothetical protein
LFLNLIVCFTFAPISSSTLSHFQCLADDPALVAPDPDCIVEGYLDYLSDARDLYKRYSFELQSLLAKFSIVTEAELISGTVEL